MTSINDYINGIERDLRNVTANEGHALVKQSILSQVNRLGDIAHNSYRLMKNGIANEIEELAKFHSIDVPVSYGGVQTTTKMVSIDELKSILYEVFDEDNIDTDSDTDRQISI